MNPLLAVTQMTSTNDEQQNYDAAKILVEKAALKGAKLICLPENFAFLGENNEESRLHAMPLNSQKLRSYVELAKKYHIWLSLGGFLEKSESDSQFFNTHIIVDNTGQVKAIYRKIHLFSTDITNRLSLDESKLVNSGNQISVVHSPVGILGLSVCYDLRFSGLYWSLLKKNAQVMLIPAAFTSTTGKAHWEILLRARAIETQSYVVAAAQIGIHNKNRRTHGHAMIVDPWGTIIAQCGEEMGLAFAEIDLQYLATIRQRIPVQKHHRPDIYNT